MSITFQYRQGQTCLVPRNAPKFPHGFVKYPLNEIKSFKFLQSDNNNTPLSTWRIEEAEVSALVWLQKQTTCAY